MPRLLHHISVRYHPNQKLLKTHPKLPQIYTYLN